MEKLKVEENHEKMWREKCEHKDVVLFFFSTKFCTYNIPLCVPKKENTYVQFSYVSKNYI